MEPIKPKKCKTVRGVARALLELYEDPKRWTRGAYYRTKHRHPTTRNKAAKCCAAGGAMLCGMSVFSDFRRAFEIQAGQSIYSVNDLQGLEAVRAVLRKMAK